MIDLSQEFACNSHLQTLGATEALFYFFFRLLENVSAELWEASAWPLPSKSELTECPTSQRRHETSMNCGCPDTTLSSANSFFVLIENSFREAFVCVDEGFVLMPIARCTSRVGPPLSRG